jgi:hypothetical protein
VARPEFSGNRLRENPCLAEDGQAGIFYFYKRRTCGDLSNAGLEIPATDVTTSAEISATTAGVCRRVWKPNVLTNIYFLVIS